MATLTVIIGDSTINNYQYVTGAKMITLILWKVDPYPGTMI